MNDVTAPGTSTGTSGTALVPVLVVGAGGMGRAWIRTILASDAARLVGVVDVVDGAARRAVQETVPEARRSGIATGTEMLEVAARCGAEADRKSVV